MYDKNKNNKTHDFCKCVMLKAHFLSIAWQPQSDCKTLLEEAGHVYWSALKMLVEWLYCPNNQIYIKISLTNIVAFQFSWLNLWNSPLINWVISPCFSPVSSISRHSPKREVTKSEVNFHGCWSCSVLRHREGRLDAAEVRLLLGRW